jgi:hypothetical protein
LGFLSNPNATDCFDAAKRLINDAYFFTKNTSQAEQNGTDAFE